MPMGPVVTGAVVIGTLRFAIAALGFAADPVEGAAVLVVDSLSELPIFEILSGTLFPHFDNSTLRATCLLTFTISAKRKPALNQRLIQTRVDSFQKRTHLT